MLLDWIVIPRSRSRSPESSTRVADHLVVAKGTALAQQAVYQGGLAVVYVRDDGQVAQIVSCGGSGHMISRLEFSFQGMKVGSAQD